MVKNERRGARQPATKFAHLQKKMQQRHEQVRPQKKNAPRRPAG